MFVTSNQPNTDYQRKVKEKPEVTGHTEDAGRRGQPQVMQCVQRPLWQHYEKGMYSSKVVFVFIHKLQKKLKINCALSLTLRMHSNAETKKIILFIYIYYPSDNSWRSTPSSFISSLIPPIFLSSSKKFESVDDVLVLSHTHTPTQNVYGGCTDNIYIYISLSLSLFTVGVDNLFLPQTIIQMLHMVQIQTYFNQYRVYVYTHLNSSANPNLLCFCLYRSNIWKHYSKHVSIVYSKTCVLYL